MSNNTKSNIICLLKKHCLKQRTIFQSTNTMTNILSKNAKQFLGPCVKLKEVPRFTFTRVLLLFCLTTTHFTNNNNNNNGSNILFQMLLSDIGDVRGPGFSVNRCYEIFPSREHLVVYAESFELENEYDMAVEKKDYDLAMKCYIKVCHVS